MAGAAARKVSHRGFVCEKPSVPHVMIFGFELFGRSSVWVWEELCHVRVASERAPKAGVLGVIIVVPRLFAVRGKKMMITKNALLASAEARRRNTPTHHPRAQLAQEAQTDSARKHELRPVSFFVRLPHSADRNNGHGGGCATGRLSTSPRARLFFCFPITRKAR